MAAFVVRRLMPFTALKPFTAVELVLITAFAVVRRLMPFTALKLPNKLQDLFCCGGCAPPNAVYGIETRYRRYEKDYFFSVVRRLMPFTALKLYYHNLGIPKLI